MEKTIVEIRNGLRAGDRLWIAEQLPGGLSSNKVLVAQVLSSDKKPRRGKRLMIYNLAIRRVEFNEKVLAEILLQK